MLSGFYSRLNSIYRGMNRPTTVFRVLDLISFGRYLEYTIVLVCKRVRYKN